MDLARTHRVAIISADSRQVFSGFDIGTAKPTASERARVPHYGVDVVGPTERYSAARWAADAGTWMEHARRAGREPLIVGGTGLYVKALIEPLAAAPELDPLRRDDLAAELERRPLGELRRWCSELDPGRAHLGRTQLLRAIETALLAGRRLSDLHAAHRRTQNAAVRHRASYIVVDPGAGLGKRIESRVDSMIAAGWGTEVEMLAREVPANAPAWKASGYGVLKRVVLGELDLSTARERVIIETRQYAKRQRTWFRHQLPPDSVTRVNPDDPALRSIVHDWWESAE